jgi:hypothetical protein
MESLFPSNVRVVRRFGLVPDGDLGVWLRASNVVALPYRRILNSGSLLLAATFACPVILPSDTPLVRVYDGQDWVHSFDVEDPVESLAAVIVATAPGNVEHEQAAARFALDCTPYDMARAFLRLLEGARP